MPPHTRKADLTASFPNRIRELRVGKGYSLAELARRVSSDRRLISKIELGKSALSQAWMKLLARELDCFPSDLLPDDQVRDRLSDNERQLLNRYRKLTTPQRLQLLAIAEVLPGQSDAAA